MSDTMLYVVCFEEVGGCRGVWKGLGVTSFLQGGAKNIPTKMTFSFFFCLFTDYDSGVGVPLLWVVVFSVNNSFHTLSKSEEKAQGRSTVNINKHKIRKTNKHFPRKWGGGRRWVCDTREGTAQHKTHKSRSLLTSPLA